MNFLKKVLSCPGALKFFTTIVVAKNSGSEINIIGIRKDGKKISVSRELIPSSVKATFDIDFSPKIKPQKGRITAKDETQDILPCELQFFGDNTHEWEADNSSHTKNVHEKYIQQRGRTQTKITIHGVSYKEYKENINTFREILQKQEVNVPKKRKGKSPKYLLHKAA
jgi:hypothetical protein